MKYALFITIQIIIRIINYVNTFFKLFVYANNKNFATKENALLKSTLVFCAHSAVNVKNSYFYAKFERISAHHDSQRTYVVVAHSILTAIDYILKDGDEIRRFRNRLLQPNK